MLKFKFIIELAMMVFFSLASIGVASVIISQSKNRTRLNQFPISILARDNSVQCINNN